MVKVSYGTAVEEIAGQMQKEACRDLYIRAMNKAADIAGEVLAQTEAETKREIAGEVQCRIKQPESIVRKLQKKQLPLTFSYAATRLNDLVGVRITCFYLDDVHLIGKALKLHKDIHLLKEKDYITKPKHSGYRSLHLIVEIPVDTGLQEQWIKVEIQIRTMAMDLWARLDHKLCYKKEWKEAQAVAGDLREYARLVEKVDVQMMSIRRKIDGIGRSGKEYVDINENNNRAD